MNTRGSVVMVALVLAVTATGAMFLYMQGVQERARTGGDLVSVVVSEEDIPAGTELDDLIAEGAFTTRSVPEDTLVDGVVKKLDQLEGRTTSAPVLADEQISTARLQGSNELPGGTLGIPDGYEALSVSLELPRLAGGAIQRGDHITAYATFANAGAEQGGPATVTLVPDVEVLLVTTQTQRQTSGTPSVMVTMALKPQDAQKLVFAQEQGALWLALLPPEQTGTDLSPTRLKQVLK